MTLGNGNFRGAHIGVRHGKLSLGIGYRRKLIPLTLIGQLPLARS